MTDNHPGPQDVIDLRSDLLSYPSEAMREAARAARPLHAFGLREDPWQIRLERRVAEIAGKEDALIFPTCSMANTTALMLSAPAGSQVLTQPGAHVLVSEAGAGAALAGVTVSAVGGEAHGNGPAAPALSAWAGAMQSAADPQRPPVRLCVVENTHTRAGGAVLGTAYCNELAALARERGIALHLDGARLFYASECLGVSPTELAAGFDTVSLSLNKAFGAPIAAVLAGSRDAIEKALVIRQRLGGGLRPVGPACAASLAGLDDMTHFSTIHALAQRLREGLAGCTGLEVERPDTPTNLVVACTRRAQSSHSLIQHLAARGLLALPFGEGRIRFVVYRGIDSGQIERAIDIARAVAAASELVGN